MSRKMNCFEVNEMHIVILFSSGEFVEAQKCVEKRVREHLGEIARANYAEVVMRESLRYLQVEELFAEEAARQVDDEPKERPKFAHWPQAQYSPPWKSSPRIPQNYVTRKRDFRNQNRAGRRK